MCKYRIQTIFTTNIKIYLLNINLLLICFWKLKIILCGTRKYEYIDFYNNFEFSYWDFLSLRQISYDAIKPKILTTGSNPTVAWDFFSSPLTTLVPTCNWLLFIQLQFNYINYCTKNEIKLKTVVSSQFFQTSH